MAKAYCARAARTVCETAIQVHGGIGNTWECLAHVYLRRALLSIDVLGGAGPSLGPGAGPPRDRRPLMDFGDSPDEAAFRLRLRAWLAANNPGLPASSTDDDYWAGQARVAPLALRRRLLRHVLAHRDRRAGPAQRLRGHRRRGAGRGRRAAPPEPRLPGQGILEHGSDDIRQRFLPGIVNGRDRWCQGFSEPDAGSDLASLRTRADRDGDEYVITGHKVWTSYSDDADWCLVLARTDHEVPKHKGISAFAVPMRQPGIEQRPLRMINGITKEFGEVIFDGARVPAANMIGEPGEGWPLAMTVVSHEREPGELGYVARYSKLVERARPARSGTSRTATVPSRSATWAGPSSRPRCCASTSAAGCPTASTGSPTVRRARSTSC